MKAVQLTTLPSHPVSFQAIEAERTLPVLSPPSKDKGHCDKDFLRNGFHEGTILFVKALYSERIKRNIPMVFLRIIFGFLWFP